jgi:hypothetical protein
LKLAEKNYTDLVLSTLVGSDFERDRLSYRDGFPKPAVIHTKNGIGWSAVPNPNVPGTKFNPSSNNLVSLAYEQSEMVALAIDRLFPLYNFSGEQLTVVHPNAANENEIVDWTLRQFSKLEIKNKMLLLQYSRPDTTEVAKES